MSAGKPTVLLCFDQQVRDRYLDPADLARLERLATWRWLNLEGGARFGANDDLAARAALRDALVDVDALVVCHGAPRLDEELLAAAPRLRLVGELEGDRFAERIDLPAAWARGVVTIDTTQGSSYPVAEWALAMIIISLRNAGAQFRHMIEPIAYQRPRDDFGLVHGELWGKTVGLIGCGHIGRRLIQFLRPFHCQIQVYDPYLAPELPDILDVELTSLETVMAESDAVVCLAPLTPRTRGMLGERELALLRPGSVFVNVSRGAIVDSAALIERLKQNDIVAGIDVFDPEPVPADSPIKALPNVFLTPHIAGVTDAGGRRFFALMVEELERFFAGRQPRYQLTPRSQADRRGEPTLPRA